MGVSGGLGVLEIKAFVPARDFELSKQFYKDIGFTMASESGGVAYFHCETASFLLQDFCTDGLAKDFAMHMLVRDVEAWWNRLRDLGVAAKYGVELSAIELQPWRMRDFCLTDPSGVVWRIAQNVREHRERQEASAMKIENTKELLQVVNADVSEASFENSQLRGAIIENVDMARCSVVNVNLSGATMRDVNLTDVTIRQANLSGMTIDGVLVTDLLSAYRDAVRGK